MFDKFASKNFQSTKIQQNTHFPHLLSGSDSEYLGTVAPHILNKGTILQPNQSEKQSFHFEGKVQEICDLEDLWNTFKQKEQVVKVKKTEIANIFDDPETLTTQEMEQIFGEQYSNVQSLSQASEHVKGNEEAQDLGDLWDMVNTEDPKQSSQNNPHQSQESQQSQTQQKNRLRSLQIQRRQLAGKSQIAQVKTNELQLKKESRQAKKQHQQPKMEKLQFYQVEQKQVQTEGRVCLTLGKDFAIYDYANFLTSCLSTSVYCYFGFKRTENEQYCFYDLTTNQPLMVGKLSKYEQYIQNNGEQRKIEYQKSYCLKIKIAHSDETIATIWLKQISNGLLYNIRHYNDYERTHDESAALVEITDSYIGKNCYCNTNVFISQKFCTHPGQLKMKLSLKNGYLIANMGVSGIKSAPYNCRLENPNNSFVYLLGLLDKEEEKFIVRVGEGISPVIAFATSIGRKRYIDSFKD